MLESVSGQDDSNKFFLTEAWPHFTKAFMMIGLVALKMRPGRPVSLVYLFYFW